MKWEIRVSPNKFQSTLKMNLGILLVTLLGVFVRSYHYEIQFSGKM